MKFLFAPDLQLASDDRSEGIHHAVGIWKGVDVRVCTGLGDDLWRSNPPTWQRVQNKDFSSASDMLELFQSLGRGEADSYVFPSPRGKGHLTRQVIGDVCRKWARAAGFHVHPHQRRHSHAKHAVQRGVDVFARCSGT